MSRESERAELHKTIGKVANDLRGAVDGWDFKTYVLGMAGGLRAEVFHI